MSERSDGSSVEFARSLLTPRERTILLAVGQRLTNGEIADTLKVSKRTVESHIASLFAKFGVQKRLDLIALAATDTDDSPPAGLVGSNALMWRELTQLRVRLRESRAMAQAQITLSQALGVLFERYRLPDMTAASRLLHGVAMRHELDVLDVAGALLVAPRPDDEGSWFPDRGPRRGPELSFLPEPPTTVSQVLDAAVEASMACADCEQADLQLSSSSGERHGLDLVTSRGFSTAFVRNFAFVDGEVAERNTTACAIALSTQESVSVPDVTRSDIFAPTALETLAAERVRAVHSAPMVAETGDNAGDCVGVLSTHHDRAGRVPSSATRGELARIAAQTGDWLAWQRRTTRLTALADLHEQAGRYPAATG